MTSKLNPYLNFKDNARQAMEFYKSVFGGNLTLNTFDEFHSADQVSDGSLIMHSMLEAENGIVFMASDTPDGMPFDSGARISMSLSGDNEDELSGYFNKLAEGGTVAMPLEKAPWGDSFGMLTDQFGVNWMVNISGSGE